MHIAGVLPAQVLDEMAKHKLGCAVVVQGQQVVGVFTTSDVCRVFAATLRTVRAR